MPVNSITNLTMGDIVQIYFTEGMRSQISRDISDWEMIKQVKASESVARSINFYLHKSLGPSAVQRRDPGGAVKSFPAPQVSSTQEHSAQTKELQVTLSVDYDVYKRAELSKDLRYAEPVKIEMEDKATALKRQMSLELHLDGTGVLGQCSGGTATVSSGMVWFPLSQADSARGHVGAFQFDEICILRTSAGATTGFDSNLATEPVYWKVVDRDFDNDRVLMRGLDSSFAELTVASITTSPLSSDVFYKYGEPIIGNLGSISDYGTYSAAMPGFDALLADDGRVVHGVTMSGATKATIVDAGDTALDVSHLEKVMNNVKTAVGASAYSWKKGLLAPQAYSSFILGREDDRRFNSVDDTTRGGKKFAYAHKNDTIELESSEFAKKKRFIVLPEARQGQGKVFEYHGTDFMEVKAPGEKGGFRMNSSSAGGYERKMVMYMHGYGTLVCRHPSAVALIRNFTIA